MRLRVELTREGIRQSRNEPDVVENTGDRMRAMAKKLLQHYGEQGG
ncbi:hypothetical protein J40TS1_12140 [Paenibacillus montaniterrae]|uniref:Uncharacterized protein n=1 Tax=Paenibacillus montaniterrae TaxID=429341 RepID=A0A919YJK0_9BACL|nr:hypothetical protein [Paenibacillus montaniterrae]GIP15572.1 hypothetical protein J40TS1_12140 [Paenibacillus montaniterrae]